MYKDSNYGIGDHKLPTMFDHGPYLKRRGKQSYAVCLEVSRNVGRTRWQQVLSPSQACGGEPQEVPGNGLRPAG